MKQDEYWNRFMESGSVMDYLGFCDARQKEQASRDDRRDTEYAGHSDCYRYDHQDHSGGGI